ncbi:3-oxoacyl-ACP synthase III family protein [Streptomyces daliensis]|uniref:Ketoacyl-ACP synthase III n=1 Tax=Streptomyces daliensis TaxID=299421 RepID=A0A8T4J1F1_9ACTN|nr:ketoacyl-ACP synthase III [Streptomyces daliensis]
MNPERSEATRIGVLGTGTYLPRRRRSNDEVAHALGVTPDWIAERTGVSNRHVAAEGEAASDLAAAAVRSAAAAAGIDADQLDLVVVATSTPDELGPSTACRVQALIGARNAVALDVGAACSGWLFAARVARDWLGGERRAHYAAVVGVEAYSKFLDPHDRGTALLFADGAAATILGPVPQTGGAPRPGGFEEITLGSDGTKAHHVLIPAGGSRLPATPESLATNQHMISMDGRAVRDFIVDIFPRLLHEMLARHRLDLSDIDAFVTHQPNPVLLRGIGENLGIPAERQVIVGDEVGNIGAASAPYALATAASRGLLTPGGRVLLAVFGAGVTWGSALLTWSGASAIRVGHTGARHTEAEPGHTDVAHTDAGPGHTNIAHTDAADPAPPPHTSSHLA